MADQQQLALLREDVIAWNQWRQEHPNRKPDLTGADLSSANLTQASLDGADLSCTDLTGANLINTHLEHFNFNGADLRGANLKGATNITTEKLEKQVKLLKGATMPDGSIQ